MAQSNDKIYTLLNDLRKEMKADMSALSEKIEKMEEKRIVPIEEDISKLKIASATGNTKIGVLIFIGSAIVSSIITILVSKVMK